MVRRSSKFKADRRLYYRPFINRGELPAERRGAAEEQLHQQMAEEMQREETRVTRKRDGERPLGQARRAAPSRAAPHRPPRPRGRELMSSSRAHRRNLAAAAPRSRHDLAPSLSLAAQVERGLPPALRTAANAVEVRRSAIHNWGLFTTRPVPKDGMVVEYMGSGLRSILADVKEKMYADLPRTIPLPPPPLPLPSLSPPPSGASLLPQVREGHRQGTGRRLLHVPPR